MKKALLFAALAISMHASSQNFPSTSGLYHSISTSKENLHTGPEDNWVNTSKSIHLQTPEQLTLVQQNDSIYTWRWDWNTAELKFESKIVNILYDVNNNLISEGYQNWEDSAWVKSSKSIWSYDANNNLISEINQNWEGDNWVNGGQYIFTYDSNNNTTSELGQNWNGNTWLNSYQYIYTYDSNNNQTSDLLQYWDGSAWGNERQYIYSYDTNNNLTSHLLLTEWTIQGPGKGWESIYTYDASNNKISQLDREFTGHQGIDTRRYTFTYDVNNNLIADLIQPLNGPYLIPFRSFYTYDSNNNRTNSIGQTWNGYAWTNDIQYNYSYDGNNNLIYLIHQVWDGKNWVNSDQVTHTYDINNNLTKSLSHYEGNQWFEYYYQETHTYDANNFLVNNTNKYFDGEMTFLPDFLLFNRVHHSDSTHYYFHTAVTDINDLLVDDGSLIVYPNPSSGIFTISSKSDIDAIEIYNLLGELVYFNSQFNHQPSTDIDLSDQVKGIYIINMYDGKHIHSRKIVVQ